MRAEIARLDKHVTIKSEREKERLVTANYYKNQQSAIKKDLQSMVKAYKKSLKQESGTILEYKQLLGYCTSKEKEKLDEVNRLQRENVLKDI